MPSFRCLWWNSFTFWLWSHLCNWWYFSTPGYTLCNIFCQGEQRNSSLQKHGIFWFKYKLKFHRKIIYNHRYRRKVDKAWTWKDIFWIWQYFQVRIFYYKFYICKIRNWLFLGILRFSTTAAVFEAVCKIM